MPLIVGYCNKQFLDQIKTFTNKYDSKDFWLLLCDAVYVSSILWTDNMCFWGLDFQKDAATWHAVRAANMMRNLDKHDKGLWL